MPQRLYEIGSVQHVQVQRLPLKVSESPRRNGYYDPSPLLVVERLLVTPLGAIGVTVDGEEVMDIHHTQHALTRNPKGNRDLSIGFTAHYAAMRARFGEWFPEGCAGENILVEVSQPFMLSDLKDGLAVESHRTGDMLFFGSLKVAAPCVEFSQYGANFGKPLPPQALKETLQFLNDGQRGFIAKLSPSQSQGSIEANDCVYVVEQEKHL